MTIRVLIVDPDIAFTVPIKRALEQSGDYVVNVFANGRAAVEAVQQAAHDVAILDFALDDMDLPGLIHELRAVQAGLFILASPRTSEQIMQLPLLDVQGSITKPYFARQLIPVIREAVAAKARLIKKEQERRAESEAGDGQATPIVPMLAEPKIQPDDTFNRLVNAIHSGDTGKSQPVQDNAAESPEPLILDQATIGDLVSGQPIMPVDTSASAEPADLETMPEVPGEEAVQPAADLAVMALGMAEDDTVPLDPLSIRALMAETSPALPPWTAAESADQPTLVEPAVTLEDTQPSRHLVPQPAASLEPATQPRAQPPIQQEARPGDTAPGGGLVQERLEAEQTSPQPPAAPVPQPAVPPMLEEPSFVAQVIEEAPPTAFPSPPPEPPAPPQPVTSEALPPLPEMADPVAKLALQLTQLTVNLSAQATLLMRGSELLASAGQMPPAAVAGIIVTIDQAWQSAGDEGNALIRFVNIPGLGDFLLYSTRTVESMTLSMLFLSDTPLRVIRQQARQLTQALETVPERAESEAATTLPSRPTDLRPPEHLYEVAGTPAEASPESAPIEAPTTTLPGEMVPRAEGPYAAYAFVWLPRADVIPEQISSVLLDWINTIAAEHDWQVEGVEIQPTYVTAQVSIPANETSTATVEALMRETAARSKDSALWADAYYIAAPGRPVTQQEIASFMEYRREAQDAA